MEPPDGRALEGWDVTMSCNVSSQMQMCMGESHVRHNAETAMEKKMHCVEHYTAIINHDCALALELPCEACQTRA